MAASRQHARAARSAEHPPRSGGGGGGGAGRHGADQGRQVRYGDRRGGQPGLVGAAGRRGARVLPGQDGDDERAVPRLSQGHVVPDGVAELRLVFCARAVRNRGGQGELSVRVRAWTALRPPLALTLSFPLTSRATCSPRRSPTRRSRMRPTGWRCPAPAGARRLAPAPASKTASRTRWCTSRGTTPGPSASGRASGEQPRRAPPPCERGCRPVHQRRPPPRVAGCRPRPSGSSPRATRTLAGWRRRSCTRGATRRRATRPSGASTCGKATSPGPTPRSTATQALRRPIAFEP